MDAVVPGMGAVDQLRPGRPRRRKIGLAQVQPRVGKRLLHGDRRLRAVQVQVEAGIQAGRAAEAHNPLGPEPEAIELGPVSSAGVAEAQYPLGPQLAGQAVQGDGGAFLRAQRLDPSDKVVVAEVTQIDHAGSQAGQPALEQPQRHPDVVLAAAEGEDGRLRAGPLHHLEVAVDVVAEARLGGHRLRQQVDQPEDAVGPLHLRLLFPEPAEGRARDLDPAADQEVVDGHDPIHRGPDGEIGRLAPGVGLGEPLTEIVQGRLWIDCPRAAPPRAESTAVHQPSSPHEAAVSQRTIAGSPGRARGARSRGVVVAGGGIEPPT